jgi:hypothetical protein
MAATAKATAATRGRRIGGMIWSEVSRVAEHP